MNNILIISLGFLAQALFFTRTIAQWFKSEQEGEVISPTIYWQISLLASILLLTYGILRNDFAIVVGQFLVYSIYIRNLQLKNAWQKMHWAVKSLAIVVDNQFRPTPTAKYLSVILDILEEAGVERGGVAIGGMMVSHEVPMSEEDIKAKLGEKNVDRILEKGWEIWQNEPRNPEANKFIGFT